MKKRTANKEIRTEKMIQGAVQVFSEKGIESAKMTEIADAADIGVASLYRYFKTKGDIAVEVGIKYWLEVNDLLVEYLDHEASGYENIKGMLELFKNSDDHWTPLYRFIEQFDHFVAKLESKPSRMEAYELELTRLLPIYEKCMDKGIKDGSIHPTIEVKKTLNLYLHTLMTLKQKHANRGLIISLDSVEAQSEEIDLLVNVFLGYLRNGL